jgi:heptosyltransferase II
MQRLGRLSLLVRVLTRSLTHGKANKIPEKLNRVVVVLTGKLGDVVCGTPVLRALRRHSENIHITVAGTTSILKPVLDHSELVDDYINLDGDKAIEKVKNGKFDAGFVTGPSFSSVAKLYLAGVPLVVAPEVVGGHSPSVTKPYKGIMSLITTFPYKMREYAPRERLRVLEPVGIMAEDTTKKLGYSNEGERRVSAFLTENNLKPEDFMVGITPSAGHKIKEWSEERFAKVADYLSDKYEAKVLLIGVPSNKERILKVESLVKNKVVLADRFNIDELKALVSKLDLLIGVDTGPIYIAEAFDVPTLDITGPIDENEQPPRGPLHRNVVPPYRKGPELFVLNARSYNKAEVLKQIDSITPELVTKEADILISLLRNGKGQ